MTVMYFPYDDPFMPSSNVGAMLGNALFGGVIRPSHIPSEQWVDLPYIYDELFADRIREQIAVLDVKAIVCRHPAALATLEDLVSSGVLNVEVLSVHRQSVVDSQMVAAKSILGSVRQGLDLGRESKPSQVVALAAMLDGVIGATPMAKAWALYQLARQATQGLRVEVGVMFGKSALAMAIGARETSNTFVGIDTWDNAAAVQASAPEVLAHTANSWDRSTMSEFADQLLALTGCEYVLIKGDSGDALRSLAAQGVRINVSMLHIDANHDYEKVRADWELWSPHLCDDHVVVFDDTSWAAGNGPRLLVNEIIDSGGYGRVRDLAGSTFLMDPHTAS